MKIKVTITLMILLFSQYSSYSQKKSTHPVKPKYSEIDVLAKKYRGVKSITLRTPNIAIEAKVSIEYNESGKPYAISFEGVETCHDTRCMLSKYSFNGPLPQIAELLRMLEEQKESKGYIYNETLSKYTDEIYTKGHMYTRFSVKDIFDKPEDESPSRQSFTICTEDFSRSGGLNSTKFDF